MWNETHHKSYGLEWTSVNEVHRHIVYILDKIFVFLWQFVYVTLCFVLSLRFPENLLIKGFFFAFFKHNAFHVGVSQRIQKLILHTIINVYPCIFLWKKVCKIFRNFMCNATHHKIFGLWLADVNEIFRSIVYIFNDIIIFLYQ